MNLLKPSVMPEIVQTAILSLDIVRRQIVYPHEGLTTT